MLDFEQGRQEEKQVQGGYFFMFNVTKPSGYPFFFLKSSQNGFKRLCAWCATCQRPSRSNLNFMNIYSLFFTLVLLLVCCSIVDTCSVKYAICFYISLVVYYYLCVLLVSDCHVTSCVPSCSPASVFFELWILVLIIVPWWTPADLLRPCRPCFLAHLRFTTGYDV